MDLPEEDGRARGLSGEVDELAQEFNEMTDRLEESLAGLEKEMAERRRVEEALRESEQKFRSIVERSPDGVALADEKGSIIEWNQGAEQVFGLTRAEVMGRPLWEVQWQTVVQERRTPLVREQIRASLLNLLETGQAPWLHQLREAEIQRPDGTRRLVQDVAFVIETAQGFRAGSIVRDVTERRRAERLLRALNELALAVEHALTPQEVFSAVGEAFGKLGFFCSVFLTDEGQSRLFVEYLPYETEASKAIMKQLGRRIRDSGLLIESFDPFRKVIWEKETVFIQDVRKVAQQLAPGSDIRIALEHLQVPNVVLAPLVVEDTAMGLLWIQSRDPTEGDIPIITAFANQVAAVWRKAQLYEQAQRRATQLSILNEIGRVVSALLGPEEVLEVIFRQVQRSLPLDAFFVCLYDAEANRVSYPLMYDDGQFYEAEDNYLAQDSSLGWTIRAATPQLISRSAEELAARGRPVHPIGDASKASASLLYVPLQVGQQVIGAISVQSYDFNAYGQEHLELLTGVAHQAAIAIENARLYDQTQRHAARLEERVIERTAELAAVNEELEAFAYSVSHDLRAPLRAIDGFCQALLEDYADVLDAIGQDYLRRVRSGGQRMAQLIDDLLMLSRLTRGEMKREEFDLSLIAEEIAAALRDRDVERQLELIIAPELMVNGDRRLLRIVLENLLDNAWKFTSNNEQARIELGVTEIDGQRGYFVRDDGVGFDMAYADKLFGAFQRLHRADEFEGTGIGLVTVQRIVQRHGGKVWAEGTEGQGATFYFTLGA